MAYINVALARFKEMLNCRYDVVYVTAHHVMAEKLGFFGDDEEPSVEETLSLSRKIFDWQSGGKRFLHYGSSAPEVQITMQALSLNDMLTKFTNRATKKESSRTLDLNEIMKEEIEPSSPFIEGGYERLKAVIENLILELDEKLKNEVSSPLSVGEDDVGPLGPGSGSGMFAILPPPKTPSEDPPPEG